MIPHGRPANLQHAACLYKGIESSYMYPDCGGSLLLAEVPLGTPDRTLECKCQARALVLCPHVPTARKHERKNVTPVLRTKCLDRVCRYKLPMFAQETCKKIHVSGNDDKST